MSAEVSFTKRAAAELSRCFNGLTATGRAGSKKQPQPPPPSASSSSATSSQQQSTSSAPASGKDSAKGKATTAEAAGPNQATETTSLIRKGSGKVAQQLQGGQSGKAQPQSGGGPAVAAISTLITKANTTLSPLKGAANSKGSKPGTPSRQRPPVPRKTSIARCKNYLTRLGRPKTQRDLWQDFRFLNHFFFRHFSSKERTVLAQVCATWREMLYNDSSLWRELMPVIYCNELRRMNNNNNGDPSSSKAPTDITSLRNPSIDSGCSELEIIRNSLYISIEMRNFDCVCLFGATDADIIDFVSKVSPATLRRFTFGSLRCSSITDKGLEIFLAALNQSLVKLELSGCNEISDSGLWTSLVPRLESLIIQDCINVADETVAAVTQMLPQLKELNLQAYHVTDTSMAYFGPTVARENLRHLQLQHCWELSNQGVLSLAHGLPHLTMLSLSGCSKVTDDAIEVIAEQFRALQHLDLSWCSRISDAALEYIACDLSDSLQTLVLDRCAHVTDIGLGYVATMSQLRSLSLRWCPQVRDFGVQTLCSLKSLESLSLAGCPQISVNGLSCLVQMQQLRELELVNCPAATNDLLKYLYDHLPSACLIII